jgi:hypothetical protein
LNGDIRLLALAALLLCCAGCVAPSTVRQTWKSPASNGSPVQKVAVVAVDERGLIRQAFENRLVRAMRRAGQDAFTTHELLGLTELKADKPAAAARLRRDGADVVLIVRLADRGSEAYQVRATSPRYVENVTSSKTVIGSFDYYSVAFTDMGTIWSNSQLTVALDTSLFHLDDGRCLWSCQTLTILGEETDRLAEADALVAKIVGAMRRDGLVR